MMKYHRSGALNNENSFSHRTGGQESKIQVLAVLVYSTGHKGSLCSGSFPLDCRWPPSHCLCVVSSLGMCTLISPWVQIFPCYKDTCHTGLRSILMASFWLDYLSKDSVFKYNHILRCWGLGFNMWILGGTQFSSSPWVGSSHNTDV